MKWDDPAQRAALIERVGADEYNRLLMAEHEKRRSVLVTVNGHDIRRVETRFGTLYAVEGTKRAFASRQQAEDFARLL